MLLQIPALMRAGCMALPVQRHEFRLEEYMDWVFRVEAQLKSGKDRNTCAPRAVRVSASDQQRRSSAVCECVL